MYPNSAGVHFYTIQPGDTYWQLAQRFNTSLAAIFAANPGVDLSRLFVGQIIRIPHQSVIQSSRIRPKHCISKAEMKLKNNMRLLWEQHIPWTRMTIISLVFKLPDVDFVIARLLRNALLIWEIQYGHIMEILPPTHTAI